MSLLENLFKMKKWRVEVMLMGKVLEDYLYLLEFISNFLINQISKIYYKYMD